MILSLLGYASDVAVLGTYWWLGRTKNPWPFHWANAIGWLPLVVIEVQRGAWPVVPITLSFGLLGMWALIRRG